MSGKVRIIGSFGDEEQCLHAITRLHEAQVRDFRIFAPIPSEKINAALYPQRSRVRAWVLSGGIFGALSGFAITLGTSFEWGLNAGGKPVGNIPPYIIIAFELMILCGGIGGVLGFFFHGRMPVFEPLPGYRAPFAGDRFGIVIRCEESDRWRLESLLRDCGAEEVMLEAA